MATQQKKQALADGIYREGASKTGRTFSAEDIEELFAPIADCDPEVAPPSFPYGSLGEQRVMDGYG